MSNKTDITELKANADIVAVIDNFVKLKKNGPHYEAKCPFHAGDKTASFIVTPQKNMFRCFGCGTGGDVIDFLVKWGKTFREAIDYLKDPNNTAASPYAGEVGKAAKKVRIEWKHVVPGVNKGDSMYHHYKYGVPTKVWPWHNEKGELTGYTCRFDFPNGGKDVLPLIYATDGNGRYEWRWQGFEKPRGLMNAEKIAAAPLDVPILIVEGEKTLKAAEKLFLKFIVTTWIGGSDGVKSADWSILKGRNVLLWPDNDQPGYKTLHNIHALLMPIVNTFKWVHPPTAEKKGWDLADAEWKPKEAIKYIDSNIRDYPGADYNWMNALLVCLAEICAKVEPVISVPVVTPSFIGTDEPPLPPEKKNVAPVQKTWIKDGRRYWVESFVDEVTGDMIEVERSEPLPPALPPANDDPNGPTPLYGSEHFRILGAQKEGNGMLYSFYSYRSKTVISMTPAGMTRNNLLMLAPFEWWKNTFPDKNTFSADMAANNLIQKSSERGLFNPRRIRGRGAWIDNKRVVIHAGDKLYVNGKETELRDLESQFIYEVGEPLGYDVQKPAGSVVSKHFIDFLKLIRFDRPVDAYLVAGFCVLAPVCGALKWRPSLWLTGPSGTGKSWVIQNVILEMLGGTAQLVEGNTSEAGLRQLIKNDALPVVFDEAEAEDKKSQEQKQMILELVRSSTTDNSGVVAKGTSTGNAKTYDMRSSFFFSSIGVQVSKAADRSRITIVGMKPTPGIEGRERFARITAKYMEVFKPNFSAGVRARTVKLLPVILKNAKTFSMAAASVIGTQRAGDQIGTLLAGAHSLISEKVITFEYAVKWLQGHDWGEEKAQEMLSDEAQLISHLMQQVVVVEGQFTRMERTTGELVQVAFGLRYEAVITPDLANDRLKRLGMKVSDDHLYISNSDTQLLRLLYNTRWSVNHNKVLERYPGAEPVDPMRFASGIKTRAVRISKVNLYPDMKPESAPEYIPPGMPVQDDKKKKHTHYAIVAEQSEFDLPDPNA